MNKTKKESLMTQIKKIEKFSKEINELNENLNDSLSSILNAWKQATNITCVKDSGFDILKVHTVVRTSKYNTVYFLKINDDKIYSSDESDFNRRILHNSSPHNVSDLTVSVKQDIFLLLDSALKDFTEILENIVSFLK